MDFGCIFMFLGIAILSFWNCKKSAVGMIHEVGINPRYYPKHYTALNGRMKKIFNIKQSHVPRYLYFELVLSLFFLILGPVNIVIWLAADCNKNIIGVLVMFHICLIITNMIFFSIMSLLFKKE